MENFAALVIPGIFCFVLIRCMLYPMQWIFKIGIHILSGFACLWILNTTSGFTGLSLPINAATAWIAGVLGVPGILVITLLELL